LYAYFGVLIYMGITIESSIEDYWGDLEPAGAGHIVKNYIGLVRFQQLNRYFRCTEPWLKDDSTLHTTFNRVNSLSEHLRLRCRKLYTPGTYLAVDETIQRFMGRASKIVNIPLKPTPEGFKVWVLANKGYVLDWLWHAKGDNKGPVDLNTTFTKEEGFSKTQAVVLNLLSQRDADTNEPLYPLGATLFGSIIYSQVLSFLLDFAN
jgi:Transposase IS4